MAYIMEMKLHLENEVSDITTDSRKVQLNGSLFIAICGEKEQTDTNILDGCFEARSSLCCISEKELPGQKQIHIYRVKSSVLQALKEFAALLYRQ